MQESKEGYNLVDVLIGAMDVLVQTLKSKPGDCELATRIISLTDTCALGGEIGMDVLPILKPISASVISIHEPSKEIHTANCFVNAPRHFVP